MFKLKIFCAVALLLALSCGTVPAAGNPLVVLETSKGDITLELWPDKAPKTVGNFLSYVDEGFYDGTIFHRVIDDFMIQGGGFDEYVNQKPTHDPIENEARADVKNTRGTIAMARTMDPHSATAQFFINIYNNRHLDHQDDSVRGFGYCVFGKVVKGMDTVEAIRKVRTGSRRGMRDVPLEAVLIRRAYRAS